MNIVALDTAYDYAEKNFQGQFKYKLEKIEVNEPRIFLTETKQLPWAKF